MTDKDLAELDILAAKVGGYVLPQNDEERKLGFKIREAAELSNKLNRPLTAEEAKQFVYLII